MMATKESSSESAAMSQQENVSDTTSVGSNNQLAPLASVSSVNSSNQDALDTVSNNTQNEQSSAPAAVTSGLNSGEGSSRSVSARTPQDGAAKPLIKRTPNHFVFGKIIGEGSFSTVSK